jgi:hypothetical protein
MSVIRSPRFRPPGATNPRVTARSVNLAAFTRADGNRGRHRPSAQGSVLSRSPGAKGGEGGSRVAGGRLSRRSPEPATLPL